MSPLGREWWRALWEQRTTEEKPRTDRRSSHGHGGVENCILRVGETFSGELAKARHEKMLWREGPVHGKGRGEGEQWGGG